MVSSIENANVVRGDRSERVARVGDLATEFRARICKQGSRSNNARHVQRCISCGTLHQLPALLTDTIWVCERKRCRKRNVVLFQQKLAPE